MKLAGVATAAVVAASALLAPPATAETAKLTWTRCGSTPGSRLECATLRVPLDYAHPRGRTIELTISRLPATDPARRIGVLLTNPGGPGGSGLTMPEFVPQLLASQPEVLARFDVIGMDPRFVGRSTPASCGLTPDEMAVPHWPGPGGFPAEVARARGIADKCAARMGWALPHATTANTARDMDVIRAALRETTVSFLGYSYGSTLGRAYAALFPHRMDRFILDSNTNPLLPERVADRRWAPNFERMFGLFESFAAARNDRYGLGTEPAAIRAAFDALIGQAPIPSGTETFTAADIRAISFRLLYAENRFDLLGRFLSTLRARQPLPADLAFLANLRFFTAPPPAPEDNFIAANYLIGCADHDYPRDLRRYERDYEADTKAFPYLGAAISAIPACVFWAVRPAEPVPVPSGDGVRLLLINSTGDPATPYAGALATRLLLPRSRLITVPASHHAVLGEYPSTCVENTAGGYLVTGRLPDRDVRCPAT